MSNEIFLVSFVSSGLILIGLVLGFVLLKAQGE